VTKQSRSSFSELNCGYFVKATNSDEKFLNHIKSSQVSFWIDSSGGPKNLCDKSFYGANPKYYIYGSLNEAYLHECDSGAITYASTNCFDFIEEKINEEKQNKDGLFVGYFSYDLSDFFFAYFNEYKQCHSRESGNPELLTEIPGFPIKLGMTFKNKHLLNSNMTDSEYLEKVKQIKDEIKAGNVYQANLSREYSLEVKDVNEVELYLKLREVSPNPYGCFFKTPFLTILSSSPEEFLYIDPINSNPRCIRTRPIKGTLSKEVFDIDPKNKAENIMIADLERNDLGRICEYGSIKVDRLLEIESYEHLNHVVSTVEGKLRSNISLKEIFNAVFPGGSITGAPKIAAMKIINDIEPTSRGAYTGSFGYIKTDGTMNFNVLIRTIFLKKERLSFNIGGGIVADSNPEDELEEIKLKAKGIMSALGVN